MHTSRLTCALTTGLIVLASPAVAQVDMTKLGEIAFPVSCNATAQDAVSEGTLLLHHMMYRQAEARFESAAKADPTCAMAQWGIAMSNFHPLWPGIQSPQEREDGLAAIHSASALEPGSTLEQAYLEAARAFYDPALETYPERRAAWVSAQKQIAADHPDNLDAAAFAALAMLAEAPPTDSSFTLQREAGTLLEGLFMQAPRHPGVMHYLIHAYDHPPLAELAIPYLEPYLAIAPETPHALHMPSHINTRLGRWEEVAELNRRSAAAALAMPVIDGTISNHYPHALDYLTYALLQIGDVDQATETVETLLGTAHLEDVFGTAYAVAAAPARLVLEQEDWQAAAALPDISYEGLEWGRYPHALAIVAFAQGIGAARGGDAAGTTAPLARLVDLRAIMAERGMGYWVTLADAQIGAIEAWLTFDAGDQEAAIAAMEAAATVEDSVGKAPVTPSHVLPVREQLGDMLMLSGQTDGAIQAYEAALEISPNRARAVAGLAEASRN